MTVVKMEESGDMRAFAEVVKGFTAAVEHLGLGRNMSAPSFAMAVPQAFAGSSAPPRAPAGTIAAPRSMSCNFCGGLDHFVRICPKAEEYVKAGKCKRMEDGRLVLPNGMFLPRYIQGATMQEHFDKYVSQ